MMGDLAPQITRTVDVEEALYAAEMQPMAGNKPVWLRSLAEVESFLFALSTEEVRSFSTRQQIHYVEPARLVAWVRDVIGDSELAASLQDVIDTGRPFGQLVPDIKRLIAERLGECDATCASDGS